MVSPPPIQVATLGWEDSLILMVLALVVFGPRRLPLIGRQIGKLMYEFRKASNDFKFQMEEELRVAEEADRRKKEEEERQRAAALAAASQASVSAPPQTVEASADVGAVEPAAATESYPPNPQGSSEEAAPIIQPPRTGEPLSAARSDSYFEPGNTAEPAAATEVNPDADVAANAAGVEARVAGNGASSPAAECQNPAQPSVNETAASPNQDRSPKEPVSQHG